MRTFSLIALSCSLLAFAACNNSTTTGSNTTGADTAKPAPLSPVALASVSPSPDFPDASLAIKSVKAEKVGTDSAKVAFEFDVKNYELKMQTTDNANKM